MALALFLHKREDTEQVSLDEWKALAEGSELLREATDMELALGLQFVDQIPRHPQVLSDAQDTLIACWQDGKVGIIMPLRDQLQAIIALADSLDCNICDDHLAVLYRPGESHDRLQEFLFNTAERTEERREINRRRVQGAPTVKMIAPPVETFKDLRIPFPLFEGPAADSKEYVGLHQCSLCHEPEQHCFDISSRTELVCKCKACNTKNALPADGQQDDNCRSCSATIAAPDLSESPRACYSCLRTGKIAIGKNTERGHITFAAVEADAANAKDILELLQTPTYASIQGEYWLFCCDRPMIFAGEWHQDDFRRATPDEKSPEQFFAEVVDDAVPGLWEGTLPDITAVYVFFCERCRNYRAHWDMA